VTVGSEKVPSQKPPQVQSADARKAAESIPVDEFAESVLKSVQSLTLELADVAGNVDAVFQRVTTQAGYLGELTTLAAQLSDAARDIDKAGAQASQQASQVQAGTVESESTVKLRRPASVNWLSVSALSNHS